MDIVSDFLAKFGRPDGGVICCNQGGELARLSEFCKVMHKKHGYVLELTGVDNPSQNGGAETMNGKFAVVVRVLLYGAALVAKYWSAALLYGVFLHNNQVHSKTRMTPHEQWHGVKPD